MVPPAGRPHREMLARMLQSAGVNWEVAVEASGWELILQFVTLGVGVAVVTACCNISRALVAIPLTGRQPRWPRPQFHARKHARCSSARLCCTCAVGAGVFSDNQRLSPLRCRMR